MKRINTTKRGQVSLILFLALIFIIIISLFIYADGLKNYFFPVKQVVVSEKVIEIENFVTDCLEQTAENGIILLGLQGGYYIFPEETMYALSIKADLFTNETDPGYSFLVSIAPFYLYKGEELVPSIEEIENQLSLYINEKISICLEELKQFETDNVSLSRGAIESDLNMKEGGLEATLYLPLTIYTETGIYKLDSFVVYVNSDFARKYAIVSNIITLQKENLAARMYGDITNLAYNEGFNYTIIAGELEDEEMYLLSFNNTLNPQYYSFAIKYA
ncbi:hypothetical protein HZB88_03200 [archaeon]|nr:hypothetical protein [archaeon]